MIQIQDNDRTLYEHAMGFARRQLRALVDRYPDFYPMYTTHGKWRHEGEAWTHWCDGFLPGMLWIIAAREPDDEAGRWWRDQAIRYSKPLEPRQYDRDVHDLGFIFMSTYYRWHQLSPDPNLKSVLIQAGRTMSMRFREKGEYLHSFISEASLFVDIMMNVGIIFYAARECGDRRLTDIAMRHCLTTRRVLVRGDGSTAHEGLFDTETGAFFGQSTHQGWRGDSCWSRGLAWSLYGFGTVYRYTRDPRFLRTAEACASYYIEHTPANGVPPWDLDAPPENRELVDTSAAAIAASGLVQLATLVPDESLGRYCDAAARRILSTLCWQYLAEGDPEWEGILKGGVYHLQKNLGVNESVAWGDYFFLEALDRVLRDSGD
ncbi:MAG TPA: glycoside hydrolase family 88 protein [Bryobacteraceae bacterium]|nr:glycoside hydrolase family 88 protein [Bryobacteraceae bacterium]